MEVLIYNSKLIYKHRSDMHISDVLSHDCRSKYKNVDAGNNIEVLSLWSMQPNEKFSMLKQETEENLTM